MVAFNHRDFELLIKVMKQAIQFQEIEAQIDRFILDKPDEDIASVGELWELQDLLTRLQKLYAVMEGNNDEDSSDFFAKLWGG